MAEADDLPKTIVRRVVKDKLSRCSEDGDISIHKDALLAFSESARIFIHYISATANDICKESRRQIINAEDVFKALEETEFTEFIRPLRASLEEFRKKNAGKKAAASKYKESETKKKRKLEGESSNKGEASGKGEAEDEASDKGDAEHEASDKGDAEDEASDKGDAEDEASDKGGAEDEASDKGEAEDEASDKGEAEDSEIDERDEGCSSRD